MVMVKQLRILFVILLTNNYCRSQQCNEYGFYCQSCDVAGLCVDDTPTNQAYICTNGTVCNEASEFECDPNASCATTTEPPTTTVAPDKCTEAGRFPDSTACNKYYTCIQDGSSGDFIKYEYTCPGDAVFNPSTSKCTAPENYDCSGSTTTEETTEITSTTELSSTEVSSSSSSSTETTEITDTSETTDSTTPTETDSTTQPSTTPGTFSCPSEGVFPNPNSCKTYYRCTQTLEAYEYTCPGSSTFNENTLQCTANPTPRCSNSTTTKQNENASTFTDFINNLPSILRDIFSSMKDTHKLFITEDVDLDSTEPLDDVEYVRPFSRLRPIRSSHG